MPKKNRSHGHYCKVCGEYKANGKFFEKGHAVHICKASSRLSAAEKRRLSDSEIKWLQAKMYDKSSEVADTAIFDSLPKEKQAELFGRKVDFAKKAGINS